MTASSSRVFAVVGFVLAFTFLVPNASPEKSYAINLTPRDHFAAVAKPLPPGKPISIDFKAKSFHVFRLDAPPGTVIDLSVEQLGVDVELFFFQTRITPFEIDSPNGDWGPEAYFTVSSGDSWLVVVAGGESNPKEGSVEVDLSGHRVASWSDEINSKAWRHFSTADSLRRRRNESAEVFFDLAGLYWKSVGNTSQLVRSEIQRGRLHEALGERTLALRKYRQIAQSGFGGDELIERLARLNRLVGQVDESERLLLALLSRARLKGDPEKIAARLRALATLWKAVGRFRAALDSLDEAYTLLGTSDDKADLLFNRGNTFLGLEMFDRAILDYEQALGLLAESDYYGRSQIIRATAMAYLRSKRLVLADLASSKALLLAKKSRRRDAIALSLITRGELDQVRGYKGAARASFKIALEVTPTGASQTRANALASLGHVQAQIGTDLESAIRWMTEAKEIYLSEGEFGYQVEILRELARAKAAAGRPLDSIDDLQDAARRIEELRSWSPDKEIREHLLASRRSVFESLVSNFVSLDKSGGVSAFRERALDAAEAVRARLLLDRLSGGGEAKRISLRHVRDLLDKETALVSFFLSDPKSFAFWIDAGRFHVVELGARESIESAADKLLFSMSRRPGVVGRRNREIELERLSRLLFEPLAPLIESGPKRIVFVPDGVLERLPLAALLEPGKDAPLLEAREVALIPSIASLAEIRRRRGRQFSGELALVADPAFGSEVPSLKASLNEIRGIQRLASSLRSRSWLGIDATRSLILGEELRSYRRIHIATHARVHSTSNESSMAFSSFPRPGTAWVTAGEISSLDWSADLVVLSACQTGLGRQLGAEGTESLGRAFLYAGARRVIVSLWPIDDEATATLMQRFYASLLLEGQSPIGALRVAQNEMRQSGSLRHRDPHFWAGFSLIGDWL